MYAEMQTPQILYPPPSLPSISPPPLLYTPPNPETLLSLLQNLLVFFVHVLLRPFSARLVPVHPAQPNSLELFPTPPAPNQAIVPVRRERRGRSKSPSSSPSSPSSATLTEGTYDGEQRRTGVNRSGFEISKVRIRGGKGKGGVLSKQEEWAKEAFKM